MKFPLVTSFCGGLVIFVACAYLGDRGAETITYRWHKPMSFESLKNQNHEQLREDLLTLQAVSFSQFTSGAPSDLQRAADYLATMRGGRQPEIAAIVDIQVATFDVEMARLEQAAGNATLADRHWKKAQDILVSLGWQDVSRETLARLTHAQLLWKAPK
ncbi:MAG: hypothetical protein WCC22_10535 [Terriglobales bacterium]